LFIANGLKSKIEKINFLCAFIATNNEHVLLTIEGKWMEAIVHMTNSKLFICLHLKEVQILNKIYICGKFWLTHSYWFLKMHSRINYYNTIHLGWHKFAYGPLVVVYDSIHIRKLHNDVEQNVKCSIDFEEQK
jgi:hypothetical protein